MNFQLGLTPELKLELALPCPHCGKNVGNGCLPSKDGGVCPHCFTLIQQPVEPVVGEGATLYVGTDRYAYTVERVSPSGKTAWIREDEAWRTDKNGLSEDQAWEFKANPKGELLKARRLSRGWCVGKSGQRVRFGVRHAYRDPSF